MSTLDALVGRPRPRLLPDPPDAPPPAGPPGSRGLARELRGVTQLPRLLRAAPWLARAPRGHGETVIDLPGWKAPEASNAPLRAYLRALGYRPRAWGLGTNRGRPEEDAAQLADRLAATPGDPPVALVGWSLGGVVAREVARALPDRVSRVVTFGTPVVGGPTHTIGASTFGEEECRRVDRLITQLEADQPIQVPITAIYTRADGIVDWRACLDRSSPHVEHVEVRSTHLTLGVDPDVWWAVARALAAPSR